MSHKPKCKMCGRAVIKTSNSGLCPACQMRKCKISIRQMQNKKGKYYKAWKLNLLEAIKKQPM